MFDEQMIQKTTESLTNHQTFQDIKTMKDQIVRVKGSDKVPILLVANKVDLENQQVAVYILGFKVMDEFHLNNIAVHADFQRKYIGRSLIEHVSYNKVTL